MRIAFVSPGSGDHFYCENCRRDLDTVRALKDAGHDVFIVPLYLPIGEAGADVPVFYGAVNVYLEQNLPGYRWLPRFLRRLLDTLPILRLAADKAGSTRATGLEDLTLSVLRGEDGRQAVELDRLVEWLADEKPDVVHLSNGLLLGLARRVKQELGIPVVCSLQDEDAWVDAMPPEARDRVWECMAERAEDVEVFLPVSHAYAERMQRTLRLPVDRMCVVYPGIDTASREPGTPPVVPVIGYYARLAECLGIDQLVDAFIELASRPGLENLRLTLAGGMTADNEETMGSIRERLSKAGLLERVTIRESFDPAEAPELLKSFTVLSVPVPAGEAFGLFAIEALSYGVPVVEPRRGAFPEVLSQAGGGVLYDPEAESGLVDALASVLLDPARRAELAECGRQGVVEHFDLRSRSVPALVDVYARVVAAACPDEAVSSAASTGTAPNPW